MSPTRLPIRLRRTLDDSYEIVIGTTITAAANDIRRRWPGARKFIITDANVEPLYARTLAWSFRQKGEQVPLLSFPAGEASKTRATRDRLEDAMLSHGTTRDSLIIALGGGVVGDIAGFAAATLLRGISYVQIPTTLLAQVDSSVGGKVAVDHPLGKNLLGAFHQPRRVYIDLATLRTLPEREFRSGMAEVIKCAVIFDRTLFAFLEGNAPRILRKELPALREIVGRSCALKAAIVERDERESGPRRLLNFGHTIGHALETHMHYTMLHGEAVAAGMAVEAELSAGMGLASPRDAARLVRLLALYGLPTTLPAGVALAELLPLTARDKKVSGGAVHYTLLRRIGAARHGIPVTPSIILKHCTP
jgi:3-dehydroquinate synthase